MFIVYRDQTKKLSKTYRQVPLKILFGSAEWVGKKGYWGLNRNDFAMLFFVLEYRWIEIGIQEKKILCVDVEKNERRNREEEKDEIIRRIRISCRTWNHKNKHCFCLKTFHLNTKGNLFIKIL